MTEIEHLESTTKVSGDEGKILSKSEVELRIEELNLAFTGTQQSFLKNYAELGNITKSILKAGGSKNSFGDFKAILGRPEAKEYVKLITLQLDWEKELTRDEVIANARRILEAALDKGDFKSANETNKFLGAQLMMQGTGAVAPTNSKDTNNLSLTFVGGNTQKEIKEDLENMNDILAKLSLPSKLKDITPPKNN